jgi:hypothetical protein
MLQALGERFGGIKKFASLERLLTLTIARSSCPKRTHFGLFAFETMRAGLANSLPNFIIHFPSLLDLS